MSSGGSCAYIVPVEIALWVACRHGGFEVTDCRIREHTRSRNSSGSKHPTSAPAFTPTESQLQHAVHQHGPLQANWLAR